MGGAMLGQRASDRAVGYSRNERGRGGVVKGAIRVEVRCGNLMWKKCIFVNC